MAESDLRDPAGAAAAAHRLMTALTELDEAISGAAALVTRTEQTSPLWGNDDSGRLFRRNYADFGGKLRPNIEQLASGLAELGGSVKAAVSSIAEADNARHITD